MKKLIIVFFALLFIVIFAVNKQIYTDGPLVEEKSVVIPKGSGVRLVSNILYQEGVVSHPWLFELSARLRKLERRLKAGEYLFSAKISVYDAVTKMEKGDVLYRKITLPEGITLKQAYDLINADEYLSGEITVEVKEGDILAQTYVYTRGDSRNSIVKQAEKALQEVLNLAWADRTNLFLSSKYEALILASIIEKETAIAEERGLVASVFANRLRIGMRLQTDPTVIYALTKGLEPLGRPLKKADLSYNDPYNTYVYAGLPPTPICLVSADSIYAALNPEESKFIYFVANGNGGHNFSKTLKEHNQRVIEWRNLSRSK